MSTEASFITLLPQPNLSLESERGSVWLVPLERGLRLPGLFLESGTRHISPVLRLGGHRLEARICINTRERGLHAAALHVVLNSGLLIWRAELLTRHLSELIL